LRLQKKSGKKRKEEGKGKEGKRRKKLATAARNKMASTSSFDLRRFRFNDLPFEVSELIWEHALPDARIFHVEQIHVHSTVERRLNTTTSSPVYYGHLQFYHTHKPPVITQICTASRKVAWRVGCFLFPYSKITNHPGVWFNPNQDILYVDRNQRSALGTDGINRTLIIAGLDRVQHVGLEWRWFLRDGSKRLEDYSSEEMRSHWVSKTDTLFAYMPSLQVIHYILPMIRHQGGYPWGREPRGFSSLPTETIKLPPDTVIPIESGHKQWYQVKAEFEKAFSSKWICDDKAEKFGDRIEYPPEIVGKWLVRVGAPTTSFEYSTIRLFDW
jgi:hypothetical protein